MKRIITLIWCAVNIWMSSTAQVCTPSGSTGNPGLKPITDSLSCIERGMFYEQIIYIENFGTITILGNQITINFLRIDSITNIPCNISWQTNRIDNTYGPNETGCIQITGTSLDSVGQYRMGIWVTVSAPIVGEVSGEAEDLVRQLEALAGVPYDIDFKYYVRVVEPGMNCPDLDTSSSANNLIASADCSIPNQISVSISGNDTICAGESTQLTANVTGGGTSLQYAWAPAGSLNSTTDSMVVASPTSTTTYGVTVTDGFSTNVSNYIVHVKPTPSSNFGFLTLGHVVTFTSFATNADTHSWNFGDGNNSTQVNPQHIFINTGQYDVVLVVTNDCSSDTITKTVNIVATSIQSVGENMLQLDLYPNPSEESFNISLSGNLSNDVIKMNLLSSDGRLLKEVYEGIENILVESILVKDLSPGIYIVQLISKAQYINKRIVIF